MDDNVSTYLSHESRDDLRIARLRDGQWQAQRRRGGHQQEGWLNIGRPGSMEHAFRHMYANALHPETGGISND